jgi:peptidoglycan/xylan/chitin deacetylase (PgdA/CDA1 family)
MRTKGIRRVFKTLIPPALIRYRGPSTQNRLALTFDDGPVPGVTDRVVQILTARGHRATFFVLGRNAESHPSLIDLIVQNGSEVANHSYSHTLSSGLSYAQMVDEVERTDRILQRVVCGQSWFRPPRGNLSWRLFVYLRRRRVKSSPVLWSVCIPHEHRKSDHEILEALRTAVPSAGDIILLHDDHATIVEALPAILDLLEERGLRSVPMSELL